MLTHERNRSDREAAHSRALALRNPELAWGWGSPAGQMRFKRRAALIAEGAYLGPGKSVLEIGCGTGKFTEWFAQSGAKLLAVDLSEELLEKARRRPLNSPKVRFVQGRFEDCGLDAPFDAIVGSSILHHLELEPAIHKIMELLRPGGWGCFAEPNILNPQVFVERRFVFLRSWFWYVSPDETAFSRWRLARSLARTGFEEIDIQAFDWLHPAVPEKAIPMVSKLGEWLERLPTIREFAGSLLIRFRRPPAK